MRIHRFAVALVAAALFYASHAVAQVPSYQQPPAQWPTYNAAISYTPAATASKDFLVITGSATKLIRVTHVDCTGQSTAIGGAVVTLNKYVTTATSGGTATTVTAQPNDSLSAAATAVVKGYTVAPTNGTGGGSVRSAYLQTSNASTFATPSVPVSFDFSTRGAEQWGILLRGTTQALALTSPSGGLAAGTVLQCNITWTEQ